MISMETGTEWISNTIYRAQCHMIYGWSQASTSVTTGSEISPKPAAAKPLTTK